MQGNVIIVDTPGIGDKDQEVVAQMMLDYLHKALAIVFVLNVANAGGIQQDRVIVFNDQFLICILVISCL